MDNSDPKDFLWLNLRDLPYFRALLRAVEASFYQDLTLENPILDLGCGDGHFASVAFYKKIDVGLDPWRKQLGIAMRRNAYRLVLQGDGGVMPFSNGYFKTVISNSVLEHIFDVNKVITEVSRVMQPGGRFIFCVPNQNFTQNLSISRFLERSKLSRAASFYRDWFNKISRHLHCDSQEVWYERLERNHFKVIRCWDYFSPQALRVLEWGHYFGIPSLVANLLTGRWVLTSARWNFILIEKKLRIYYEEEKEQKFGSYSFYVSQKEG